MKKLFIIIISVLLFTNLLAQKADSKHLDWYNKDVKSDKAFGISTEKAYQKLLKGKIPQTVIVAVIDGGTDIKHEDLQGVIWINTDEIPGNGIDDDHNGYIDDVYGWNFIGNASGENVNQDNLELTRIFRKLDPIYAKADPELVANDANYKLYKEVKSKYNIKSKEAKSEYPKFQEIYDELHTADSIVIKLLNKTEYTLADIKDLKSDNKQEMKSISTLKYWLGIGVSVSDIKEYADQLFNQFSYQYNVDFDPRGIVGDNYEVNSSPYYGNNDVTGPAPSHGTFVAGNIGAVRNNGIGANGVAGNVQLMIIRVVPDGDERDKDVANGILYAVNNGAKVINMSFGKSYSPQKRFVDSVLRIADAHDVVLVHAAGNDGENNDVVTNYPENRDANNQILCRGWITVGASGIDKGKNLPAAFSNYGKQLVDVFAPGVDLWGLKPGNKYESASGTSMASPVVAGLAAVIRGYFPELTAADVRDIIIRSATKYTKDVDVPNANGDKKTESFTELSVSGGVANLYNAIKLAEEVMKGKKK
ncbi:MAG: S8 family serine peptidase [Bacteroidota bacterium]